MRKIIFEPIMDGWKRKAIVKDRVNGYKHAEAQDIHFFQRGNIAYIVNVHNEAVTLEKFDYSKAHYLSVEYNDFRKFVDVEKVEKIS